MIVKTIQYKNFLGETETEQFYFNYSKGELVMMQMAAIDQKTESFEDKLKKIGKTTDGKELVAIIKEIVWEAYGEKTTDGKRFVKVRDGKKLVEDFISSNAWSELVVELLGNENAMADFMNGLMPADLRDEVQKEVNASQAARDRSQANLQGHQKKQDAPVKSVPVRQEPDLPTVIEGTAEPVLEPTPMPVVPNNDLTTEELEALLAARKTQV